MLDDVGNLLVFAMGSSSQQPIWLNFVPFAMVLAILYFLILLPMKKQRKKVEDFQSSLKVNDKVVTTGGIYGVITRVNDNSIQLQIADKVRIELSRNAIVGYQGQESLVDSN
jgi:preprotein translocase subunit YajC